MGRKLLLSLAVLFGLLTFASGCNNNKLRDNIEFVTQEPEDLPITPGSFDYPATPEDVVMAFLNTYPVTPTLAIQYLAPKYVQSLDEKSALTLLPVKGEFDGFVIENGNTSAEDAKSMILARMLYGETEYRLIFLLLIEGGHWQIEAILPP